MKVSCHLHVPAVLVPRTQSPILSRRLSGIQNWSVLTEEKRNLLTLPVLELLSFNHKSLNLATILTKSVRLPSSWYFHLKQPQAHVAMVTAIPVSALCNPHYFRRWPVLQGSIDVTRKGYTCYKWTGWRHSRSLTASHSCNIDDGSDICSRNTLQTPCFVPTSRNTPLQKWSHSVEGFNSYCAGTKIWTSVWARLRCNSMSLWEKILWWRLAVLHPAVMLLRYQKTTPALDTRMWNTNIVKHRNIICFLFCMVVKPGFWH